MESRRSLRAWGPSEKGESGSSSYIGLKERKDHRSEKGDALPHVFAAAPGGKNRPATGIPAAKHSSLPSIPEEPNPGCLWLPWPQCRGESSSLAWGSADAAGVVQDLPRVFHCLGTQDQAGPVEGLEVSCPGDKRSKTFYFW